MGNPAYLTGNLVTASTTITFTTENSSYPKANLYDKIIGNPARWTNPTTAVFEVDLGSAQSPTRMILGGHNINSGSTIAVLGGSSSPASVSMATPTWAATYIEAVLSGSYQYWRLTINDSGDHSAEPLGVGQLVIGTPVEFPLPYRVGFEDGFRELQIRHDLARGGVINYQLADREYWRIHWDALSSSEVAQLRTFAKAVGGDPFFFWPDISVANGVYYVRKAGGFNRVSQGNLFGGSFELVEESRGEYLTA